MKTCIKYHGGKSYLASKLVGLMPVHQRYLEPYFGGGSILFAKPHDGIAEWVNDINQEVTNFWRVMASESLFERFRRCMEAVPLSEMEFALAKSQEPVSLAGELPDEVRVKQACDFFVRNRMSRQGLSRDYCNPSKRLRRDMNENVSAWLTAVDGLPEFHKRLRRVEVWNRPATKAIEVLDGEDLLCLCDPPYLHTTRSSTGEYGAHEMTEEQHVELLNVLANMQGKFMLCGYPSELYDQAASEHGWNRVIFEVPNNSSGAKKKEIKRECVWMNF